jgi:hypothetical protein
VSDQDLHRQEKARIIERLMGAGWEMAEGAATLNRAYLIYDNGHMNIELEQDRKRRELLLTLAAPDGRDVTVYPVYGDSLDAVLEAVIDFQERVNPQNFRDMILELVAVCPEVYVQEGEDDEPRLLTAE